MLRFDMHFASMIGRVANCSKYSLPLDGKSFAIFLSYVVKANIGSYSCSYTCRMVPSSCVCCFSFTPWRLVRYIYHKPQGKFSHFNGSRNNQRGAHFIIISVNPRKSSILPWFSPSFPWFSHGFPMVFPWFSPWFLLWISSQVDGAKGSGNMGEPCLISNFKKP